MLDLAWKLVQAFNDLVPSGRERNAILGKL
jgi:hypothetical protein